MDNSNELQHDLKTLRDFEARIRGEERVRVLDELWPELHELGDHPVAPRIRMKLRRSRAVLLDGQDRAANEVRTQ